MHQGGGKAGVEITYFEDAPVIFDCDTEAEAREMVQTIESAISSGQREIELDDLVKVSLDNVRSIDLAVR